MTVMLYKYPGPYELHGSSFDYIIVDEKLVDDALSNGWALTTPEALEIAKGGQKELDLPSEPTKVQKTPAVAAEPIVGTDPAPDAWGKPKA